MNPLDEMLMETRIAEARAERDRERLRQRAEAIDVEASGDRSRRALARGRLAGARRDVAGPGGGWSLARDDGRAKGGAAGMISALAFTAFIISLLLAVDAIEPSGSWLVTVTVLTGLTVFPLRWWYSWSFDQLWSAVGLAAFIIALLLTTGTLDSADEGWLIALTVLTGIMAFVPRPTPWWRWRSRYWWGSRAWAGDGLVGLRRLVGGRVEGQGSRVQGERRESGSQLGGASRGERTPSRPADLPLARERCGDGEGILE